MQMGARCRQEVFGERVCEVDWKEEGDRERKKDWNLLWECGSWQM